MVDNFQKEFERMRTGNPLETTSRTARMSRKSIDCGKREGTARKTHHTPFLVPGVWRCGVVGEDDVAVDVIHSFVLR